jgi:hypothetical protein
MSILKDQKINWTVKEEKTSIEKKDKQISDKEAKKMIDSLIMTLQTVNEKCKVLYEQRPMSELSSVIVMNESNLLEMKKIKSKYES